MRSLYEDMLQLTPLPESCPTGHFSVSVGTAGSPMEGILTFAGSGSLIRAVTFAVGKMTLPRWQARLSQGKASLVGRAWQFEEEHLCFVDASGFDLALAEINGPLQPGDADRALGVRAIELIDGPSGELQKLLEAVGLKAYREEGPIIRLLLPDRSDSLAIDIFRSPKNPTPHPVAQRSAQRISFKVSDPADLALVRLKLIAAGFEPLPFCHTSGIVVRLRSQPGLEIGVRCMTSALQQIVRL